MVRRWTFCGGDRGSRSPAAVSKPLQSRSPHIVCLSEETKSHWSLLSGVYAWGSKTRGVNV